MRDYSLDAGLTYAEASEAGELEILPAYEESYVLVAPADLAPRKTGAASWKEAAALPLCLLSKDMRNRALIDAFRLSFQPTTRADDGQTMLRGAKAGLSARRCQRQSSPSSTNIPSLSAFASNSMVSRPTMNASHC